MRAVPSLPRASTSAPAAWPGAAPCAPSAWPASPAEWAAGDGWPVRLGEGDAETDTQTISRTSLLPPYNVILLDDDDHTYEYVVEMLRAVFGMSPERAYLHACEVDASKRTIVLTTTKEHAELKVEQIHAYGKDPRIPRCSGSMSAIIEPAP